MENGCYRVSEGPTSGEVVGNRKGKMLSWDDMKTSISRGRNGLTVSCFAKKSNVTR